MHLQLARGILAARGLQKILQAGQYRISENFPSHQAKGTQHQRAAIIAAQEKQLGKMVISTITVGKYLVSPLVKRLEDSLYAASVSIKRGGGSTCTDWVLRFAKQFESADAATGYATQQGIHWINERAAYNADASTARYCAA